MNLKKWVLKEIKRHQELHEEFGIVEKYGLFVWQMNLFNYEDYYLKTLQKSQRKIEKDGNYSSFFNRKYGFKAMGFDIFYDLRNMNFEMKGWGAPDEDVFDFVSKEIKKEKLYLSHNYNVSHFPFVNVLNYYDNPDLHHPEREVRNYFLSMSYVDTVLKKYLEEFLKLPNTYIFIYGDHTPGLYFNAKNYQPSILFMDFKKYELVPLLIITPDRKSYFEEKLCASFLDIAPTVLISSGVPFEYYFDGENLLEFPINDSNFSPYGKIYKRSEIYKKIDDEFKYLLKILK